VIVTNRDLNAMRDELDRELFRLHALRSKPNRPAETERIERQIGLLCRRRVAICAAIVNRRIEASRNIVSLLRWASGCGALDNIPGLNWVGGGNFSPFLAKRGS